MAYFISEILLWLGVEIRFFFSKIIGKNRSRQSLSGFYDDQTQPSKLEHNIQDPVQSVISKIIGVLAIGALVKVVLILMK